jgi:hypothetical protein
VFIPPLTRAQVPHRKNVPRELLTDPHLNVAALAGEFNLPAWELTRANIEYACELFPVSTLNR